MSGTNCPAYDAATTVTQINASVMQKKCVNGKEKMRQGHKKRISDAAKCVSGQINAPGMQKSVPVTQKNASVDR